MRPQPIQVNTIASGLAGAAVGGCLGYYAFFWILSQGLYALVIPGGLLGLGAGLAVRERSSVLAVICGFASFGLGAITEWRFAPFKADPSLGYFLSHLHQLQGITWLMLVVGTVISYRLAFGFDDNTSRSSESVR